MKIYISIVACLIIFGLSSIQLYAQQDTLDISKMTREQVLDIPYEQLIDMPLDQLLMLADIVGVSLEELYEMILNKDVVSASKKVESSFEAPLSTSVISYDEIIASGARNIEEALRLVPGLIVREKTNGNFDIHLRGNDNLPPKHMFVYSENSITLVMINNRPVYNYVHGGTFWETLPVGIDDIERIEVVRGPSSALYGPNAVSGVVNIITKKAESKELKVSANAQAGNLNTQIGSIGIGKKLNDKIGLRVTGNYYHQNRATDKLYVYKRDKYLSLNELDTATFYDSQSKSFYKIFDPSDDINKMFPDPGLARQNYGVNAYLYYDINEKMNFDLSSGYQFSDVISSTMGDNPFSTVGRVSNTGYIDLRAKVHGLRAQVNILDGWQDIVKEDTGFKVDVRNINANVEYDINIGNLNVRPGVAYQYAMYNDLSYLSYEGQGFLNGKTQLNSLSATLRADYLAFEKLRLIAALRGDKYNTHNDPYLSYQFIAAYNLNDQHMFRLVHSKANRGPFLVDSYADYLWIRDARPNPGIIHFKGQQNLDLLTMNQTELGYRIKPLKYLQVDIELFHTKTNGFGALYPDSVNLNIYNADRPFARMIYQNLDLKSTQNGITGTMSFVVSKNLYFKVYGTYQKTKLKDVIPFGQEATLATMLTTAYFTFTEVDSTITYSTSFPAERENQENKSTPAFYGGFSVDYKLLEEKLNINVNAYYLGEQVFQNKYGDINLNAQYNVNAKVSYKIYKNSSIYINVRNLLSNDREFAYMDKITPLLLGGVNLNF